MSASLWAFEKVAFAFGYLWIAHYVRSHKTTTMTKTFLLAGLLAASCFSAAQPNLSEGAQLLFKNIPTKLTAAEKNTLFSSLDFLLSRDKKQFIGDKDGADYPFDAQVFPTDLNKDGSDEIFVVYGNTYTSGNAGSSVVLFIKNGGSYKKNLGFPGLAPDVLATANGGYADLLIGGPGMTFLVWRWNGKEYAHYKEVKDSDYDKLKKTDLETVSKTYMATLKTKS